jgi:hypothetical protein
MKLGLDRVTILWYNLYMLKTCKKCLTPKEATSEFFYSHYNTKDGFDGTCKACRLARMKVAHDTDEYRAQRKIYWKDWRKSNIQERRAKERVWERKRRCNLTPEQYDTRIVEQCGCCAICGEPFYTSTPHADHNHETGEPRGLLCRSCNSLLGYAYENPETLHRAIVYLKKWEPR